MHNANDNFSTMRNLTRIELDKEINTQEKKKKEKDLGNQIASLQLYELIKLACLRHTHTHAQTCINLRLHFLKSTIGFDCSSM